MTHKNQTVKAPEPYPWEAPVDLEKESKDHDVAQRFFKPRKYGTIVFRDDLIKAGVEDLGIDVNSRVSKYLSPSEVAKRLTNAGTYPSTDNIFAVQLEDKNYKILHPLQAFSDMSVTPGMKRKIASFKRKANKLLKALRGQDVRALKSALKAAYDDLCMLEETTAPIFSRLNKSFGALSEELEPWLKQHDLLGTGIKSLADDPTKKPVKRKTLPGVKIAPDANRSRKQ